MVDDDPRDEYDVLLTPQFLDDLEACVRYIGDVLKSPVAAKQMYEAVRKKIMGLRKLPQAAVAYESPVSGKRRYKVSCRRYDIHYCVEGGTVRVLGIKHQLQNDNWIE